MPIHLPTYLPPVLHDLVVTVAAPSTLLCTRTGHVDAEQADGGAHGFYCSDVRALCLVRLRIAGTAVAAVRTIPEGPGRVRFISLPRDLAGSGPDPAVRVDQRRVLGGASLTETITITSTVDLAGLEVRVDLGCDLLDVASVKSGRPPAPLPARTGGGGLEWSNGPATVQAMGAGATHDPVAGSIVWRIDLRAGTEITLTWTARADVGTAEFGPVTGAPPWARPTITADDPRLAALVGQALDDLDGLRLAPPESPGDVFLAAGAPWFFTLFGRDSIWAARMLLPLGTELALGTLRCLASRQGRSHDPRTGEDPGKIPHEVRGTVFADDAGLRLPPVYYGTVDATPLWICLLHDAWWWGAPPRQIEPLLPNLLAALEWMADSAAAGHGFLRYRDESGSGLANQGWKDSGDAIRFADGSMATGPVALAEVQGYAYEAAMSAATLLDAFGHPGAERWRTWAANLAGRFRQQFWIADGDRRFPALALDGSGTPVDSITSNAGHLLGTGLLTPAESTLVATAIADGGLAAAYGLRTMSPSSRAFNPLSYHCGSVWPHDTAIVAAGLARTGHDQLAAELVEGLLAASESFDRRLPELWGGDARDHLAAPVPYPAACRPQAWSAAAAIHLLTAITGIAPHAPAGRTAGELAGQVSIRPLSPSPVGAVVIEGLRLGGRSLGPIRAPASAPAPAVAPAVAPAGAGRPPMS